MERVSGMGALTGKVLEEVVAGRRGAVAKSTRQGDEALLKQMQEFVGGDVFGGRVVDEAYVRELASWLLARVKPSTARNYLERLNTWLKVVRREGLAEGVPEVELSALMPERRDAEKVYLTKEELMRMRRAECPAESTKNAFLFSCYTGLLKGEVQELRWDAIRMNGNGIVLTRPVENSGEDVKVPLVEPAREILQRVEQEYSRLPYEEQDDRVFHLYSSMTINEHLKKWAKAAGVEKPISYMTSRHTFATMALRAGVDLYVLAKWCGYSNVSSAEVYADMIGRRGRSDSEILASAFA